MNATATKIFEFVVAHPGKTKREIATDLSLSIGTVKSYILQLNKLGLVESDDSNAPKYTPGKGRSDAESVKVVIGAMHAMVSVGNGEIVEREGA